MRDKHHITEERNEGKLSRSVLETSGAGDSLAEFNATTSTNKAWNGSQLQATRDRYSRVRASLQSKRTRGSRRLLKRLSGKEARFQKNINHSISRQLVNEAKTMNAALAFEDLTNIRKSLNTQPRSKTERRRTNNWAFYQLRIFVTYKAVLAGVPVVFVPPAYTSQTCSRCHHVHPEKGKSYRNGKVFKCGHCGLEADADWNAANNIATLGLLVLGTCVPARKQLSVGAVVNQPESSVMSCVLEGQLSLLCSTFNQG